MKKINVPFWFMASVCFLATVSLFGQTREKGKDLTILPVGGTIEDGDGGGSNPNCYSLPIKITFNLTNLENFEPNYSNNSGNSGTFLLPHGYPEMAVEYNLWTNTGIHITGTEEITEFQYAGEIFTSRTNSIKYFSATLNLSIYDFNNCESGDYPFLLVDYSTQLVRSDNHFPYPVCDYLDNSDIFECTVFDLCNWENDINCDLGNKLINNLSYSFDCISCIWDKRIVVEGTRRESTSKDHLSPNPFETFLNLNFEWQSDNPIRSIEVYSTDGQLLYKTKLENPYSKTNFQLDLNHLPSGLLMVKVDRLKTDHTYKVIKQ